MKLKVSAKDAEKYSVEDEKINRITDLLKKGSIEESRNEIIDILEKTKFRTKFDEPEKDITKYLALKILKEEEKITLDNFVEFFDKLWEIENSSVREISSFIMGQIYQKDR